MAQPGRARTRRRRCLLAHPHEGSATGCRTSTRCPAEASPVPRAAHDPTPTTAHHHAACRAIAPVLPRPATANDQDRLGDARRHPPITVTVGGIGYHPEAIVLLVKPKRAFAGIYQAVQAATRAVRGSHDPHGTPPSWIPHITVCYSTADQPMAPIVTALATQQRECRIQITTVSLVIQHGPERLWDWRTVGAAHLRASASDSALIF